MKHIKLFQSTHGLVADGIIGKKTLQAMRCTFGIQTDIQLAHFLANVDHETGGFNADTENLNYSALRLQQIFKKYFPTDNLARQYANNPIRIANRVYANRMGNGNEASGDGWKYIGRGAIQLTGKDNYKAFAAHIGDNSIMANPEQVAKDYFWDSALFYFTRNKLWEQMKYNDPEVVKRVRKAVNGGTNGLNDVQEKFIKYYNLITK